MDDAVATRFAASAASYESQARIQRLAAQQFADWLGEQTQHADAPQSIVEIGCGTGFLTRALQARHADVDFLATDIAAPMVDACRARMPADTTVRFAVCDGRNARFDPAPDWIVSALCFQWFEPLAETLALHARQSRLLAFSIVLDGSFAAWHRAHQAAGLTPGLRVLPDYDHLVRTLQSWQPARLAHQRLSLNEHHADGRAFIRALRDIGADQPRHAHRPVNLKPVLRQCANGLTVNYEIGFFCIEPSLMEQP